MMLLCSFAASLVFLQLSDGLQRESQLQWQSITLCRCVINVKVEHFDVGCCCRLKGRFRWAAARCGRAPSGNVNDAPRRTAAVIQPCRRNFQATQVRSSSYWNKPNQGPRAVCIRTVSVYVRVWKQDGARPPLCCRYMANYTVLQD